MKLYAWKGTDVLPNYGGGVAVAMAGSLGEAKEVVMVAMKKKIVEDCFWMYSVDGDDAPLPPDAQEELDEYFEQKTAFLGRDPDTISDGPFVVLKEGSE